VAGIALALSGLVIVSNWALLVRALSRKRHESTVPLVGGLLGAVGLVVVPLDGFARFWWVPLLIDYRCAFTVGSWIISWWKAKGRGTVA